jgi:phosphate transport system substrate-binding protein
MKYVTRVVVSSVAVLLGGAGLSACHHTGHVVNVVGSETTTNVMKDLASYYNNHVPSGSDVTVFNTPPVLAPNTSFTVDGNNVGACPMDITYKNPGNLPPDGSSEGITALVNEDQGSGCTDAARSSRYRIASDPSTLEFYAFAKEGVSWAHFGTTNAPTDLTQAQLRGIYVCDQGSGALKAPTYTNWKQVGGGDHAIARYLPQSDSEMLPFFETKVLGLTTAEQGVVDDAACATRPTRVAENSGTAVPDSEKPLAIVPYSVASFVAQAYGSEPDVRGGSTIGSINGVAPSASTINNKTFLGIRWVYNVLKTTSPDYYPALQVAGVTASYNGLLCQDNANVQQIIAAHGFVNNPVFSAGPGLPNSRCRKNPAPL